MDDELRQSIERIQEIVRNHKGVGYSDVLAKRLDAVVEIVESQATTIARLTAERDEAREARDELQVRLTTLLVACDDLQGEAWNQVQPSEDDEDREVFAVEVGDWRKFEREAALAARPSSEVGGG